MFDLAIGLMCNVVSAHSCVDALEGFLLEEDESSGQHLMTAVLLELWQRDVDVAFEARATAVCAMLVVALTTDSCSDGRSLIVVGICF